MYWSPWDSDVSFTPCSFIKVLAAIIYPASVVYRFIFFENLIVFATGTNTMTLKILYVESANSGERSVRAVFCRDTRGTNGIGCSWYCSWFSTQSCDFHNRWNNSDLITCSVWYRRLVLTEALTTWYMFRRGKTATCIISNLRKKTLLRKYT